jgi:hypothetical protein
MSRNKLVLGRETEQVVGPTLIILHSHASELRGRDDCNVKSYELAMLCDFFTLDMIGAGGRN